MSKPLSAMQDLKLTKKEMVNTIIILMGLDKDTSSQLEKLSIDTLNAMYESLNKIAMECNRNSRDARYALEREKMADARNKSLYSDLRKLKGRKS